METVAAQLVRYLALWLLSKFYLVVFVFIRGRKQERVASACRFFTDGIALLEHFEIDVGEVSFVNIRALECCLACFLTLLAVVWAKRRLLAFEVAVRALTLRELGATSTTTRLVGQKVFVLLKHVSPPFLLEMLQVDVQQRNRQGYSRNRAVVI